MKLIPLRFQPDKDHIDITVISDLHCGASSFNQRKALKHRDFILAEPDRYCIDLGDTFDNTLKSSIGNVYENTLTPSEQRSWVKEYYRPMNDRLLAVCESNHSERSVRDSDFSPQEWLSDITGSAFIRYQAVLAVTVGDSAKGQTYLLHLWHGSTAAQTDGGLLNALLRLPVRVQGCHAYLSGHAHRWVHHTSTCFIPDARHRKVKHFEQHVICNGSFLDYDATYAEAKGYQVPTSGMANLRLYRDEFQIDVERLV